jgi:hypothetical protein
LNVEDILGGIALRKDRFFFLEFKKLPRYASESRNSWALNATLALILGRVGIPGGTARISASNIPSAPLEI